MALNVYKILTGKRTGIIPVTLAINRIFCCHFEKKNALAGNMAGNICEVLQ